MRRREDVTCHGWRARKADWKTGVPDAVKMTGLAE